MIGTVETRIKKVVADYFGRDPDALTPTTTFDGDLGSDSLERVEVLMAVEDEFQIEIDDADGVKVASIGDAIALVERLTGVPAT